MESYVLIISNERSDLLDVAATCPTKELAEDMVQDICQADELKCLRTDGTRSFYECNQGYWLIFKTHRIEKLGL